MPKNWRKTLKKTWRFIWEDDSALSWIVSIILAFVLIKFVVYPVLGLLLGTSYPIVAVVSGSMEHRLDSNNVICGKILTNYDSSFDSWWSVCGEWYIKNNIKKSEFSRFSFKNGFNTGDIMILKGADPDKIKTGDILVYKIRFKKEPIIHRIIQKTKVEDKWYFKTKGDHNADSSDFEKNVSKNQMVGKAVFKIPLLGYIKIMFVKFLNLLIGVFR